MKKTGLILIGGGGHCRSVIDVVEHCDGFEIQGIVDHPDRIGENVLGYPIVGSDNDIGRFAGNGMKFLVTVGQIQSSARRRDIFEKILAAGGDVASVVSPRAHVSKHATIGRGSIVMHDALVNAGVVVGNNCIVNTKALLEHDVIVEDHCHISTAAVLNGGVIVREGSFVGSNATIRESIEIKRESVVPAGRAVFKDR